MRVLLDTCTFLWISGEVGQLSAEAKEQITNPANEIFLSSASVWEIALKYIRGRLILTEPPQQFVPKNRDRHGVTSLPITEDAALHLSRLPGHHNDPFDRMLVCQAIAEDMTIVTPDELIRQYPVRTIW
jgi:PIN domain nuclease of toxin-antitoxin system